MWRDVADYFPAHRIANRGFGGSTMRDVLYWYETLVTPHAPAQMLVYEGDNDLADRNYTVEQFIVDVECFVRLTQVRYPQCDLCLVSVKPSPSRRAIWPKIMEANRLMKELCEKRGARFIDAWSQMVDAEGNPTGGKDYFLEDRLHMNAEGYKLWARIIEPCLIK
ncbi:MAG: GDSL-type esterase/lipase family protein [Rikenellaceae bacterium]|jgi:lysophospholipase L1-like esterase|nr:GDSL-type esterase/lipase family protein [Rikenellaceae bacterium]